MHKQGRPVLVGTTSVERSETLAEMLQEAGAGLLPTAVQLSSCFDGNDLMLLFARKTGLVQAVFNSGVTHFMPRQSAVSDKLEL